MFSCGLKGVIAIFENVHDNDRSYQRKEGSKG